MTFIRSLVLAFSFLPLPVQIVCLGVISILSIILVFKVVALVLDAIPFL